MNGFSTQGFAGYSVSFSPFYPDLLATATASNFGIVGNGKLFVYSSKQSSPTEFQSQDGLFDVVFSEIHDKQILTASGDGSLHLWDWSLPNYPIAIFREHNREVFSVNWNLIHKNHFISSSWDSSIKVWDPLASSSILTLRGHVGAVYSVSYSPKLSTVFASASSDSSIKLWDERSNTCSSSFFTNSGEVLSIDWNKYQPNVIISGSVDKSVKVWDLRNPSVPRNSIVAHDFAVRRVKCSPHSGNVIATASYDATMKLFDILTGQQLFLNNAHSEFVFGVDFNLFRRGLVATCGWDGKTIILECPV